MKLSDRLLSSKIKHKQGIKDCIPYENYTLAIKFLSGEKSSLKEVDYKSEFDSLEEAKKEKSRQLIIIEECLEIINKYKGK